MSFLLFFLQGSLLFMMLRCIWICFFAFFTQRNKNRSLRDQHNRDQNQNNDNDITAHSAEHRMEYLDSRASDQSAAIMSGRTVLIGLQHLRCGIIWLRYHMYQNRQEKITKNRCDQFDFRNPVWTIGNKKWNAKENYEWKEISHKAKQSESNTWNRLSQLAAQIKIAQYQ